MRHLALQTALSPSAGCPSVFPELTQPRDRTCCLLFPAQLMLSHKVLPGCQGTASVFVNGCSLRRPIPAREENFTTQQEALSYSKQILLTLSVDFSWPLTPPQAVYGYFPLSLSPSSSWECGILNCRQPPPSCHCTE